MGGHRTQVPALGASGGLPLRSGSGSGENESTSGLADWGGGASLQRGGVGQGPAVGDGAIGADSTAHTMGRGLGGVSTRTLAGVLPGVWLS